LTVDLSPPAIVKIKVEAYFALTAGALMLGAKGTLDADVAVGKGHAELSLDAIFYWSPHVGFEVDLHLSISIEAFGASLASIGFDGRMAGTTPWSVHGSAHVDVWFLPTFDFDVGPVEWGDKAPAVEPAVDTLKLVRDALADESAWHVQLPPGGDMLVRLGQVDVKGVAGHPLAGLEVVQSRLPLETEVARIGSAPVTAHRIHLDKPTTSAGDFGALSTVSAAFAPGKFLDISDEKLLSRPGFEQFPAGARLAPTAKPRCGSEHPEDVTWRTYFHTDDLPPEHQVPIDLREITGALALDRLGPAVLRSGRVAAAARERVNPYAPTKADGVRIDPAGRMRLRNADDLTVVADDLGALTATEAARVRDVLQPTSAAPLVAVAVGA
jgi:hypothetical protein